MTFMHTLRAAFAVTVLVLLEVAVLLHVAGT